MSRLIAANPGLIGGTQSLGPGRRATGIEAIQTPEGETRYALQIRNARTGTTGPEQPEGSIDPKAPVNSYSAEQLMRGFQPFLPAAPDPTTEQRNIRAFMERNPGAKEADYFAQKRSPGVSVYTGDQGEARPPSAAYDPATGTEPGKDRAFQFDPTTQKFERNELGLPVQVPNPGSAADPSTKTDESAIKVGIAAEGGKFSLDILSKKNNEGESVYDELAKFGQHFLGKVPVFGNYLVSETYQKAYHAVTNFVEGQLRLASGAAVPPHEIEGYRKLYSPLPGDTAGVIKQKMEALKRRVDFAIKKAGMEPREAEGTAPQDPETAVQPPGAPAAPPQPAPGPAPAPVAAPGGAQAASLPAPVPEASPASATIDPKTIDPAIFANMGEKDLLSMYAHATTMGKEAYLAMDARARELGF